MIITLYGESIWEEVRERAKVDTASWMIHDYYSDSTLCLLSTSFSEVVSISEDNVSWQFWQLCAFQNSCSLSGL